MNKLLYLLLIAVCWSCSQDSETEKHQSKRDQVVDVRDKMKEFSTQDVLIGRISRNRRDEPPLLCIGSRQTENIRLRPGQCFNDSGISAKCKNRYEEKTVSG